MPRGKRPKPKPKPKPKKRKPKAPVPVMTVPAQVLPPIPMPNPGRRKEDRDSRIGRWLSRTAISAIGLGITYWAVRDIVITDRQNPVPPPVGHYILIGLFAVIGLGLAGGKRTLDVLASITRGIKAWRATGSDRRSAPTDEHPTTISEGPP